jgi:UDP-N-acetylmuramoyl-tripeptide--D-alanyl-D-alanine ligase
MIELAPEQVAAATGAEVLAQGSRERPARAVIDSREVAAGDLFFGLVGEHDDGGRFAATAIAQGAWGAFASTGHAAEAVARLEREGAGGWIFATDDPLRALQDLARAWRREIGCRVAGITGSTGKTSVKDICRAILPFRVHASPENFNTEIGLPLTILGAPAETEVLVLEMAMRGQGQIAQLCAIAEPEVGAITNVGPVHLELLGTLEAIAAAKAEILHGLAEGGRAVVPADAEALAPHLSESLPTLTFGPGGDVFATQWSRIEDERIGAHVVSPGGEADLTLPFTEAHNLVNALCALAVGESLGAPLDEMAALAPGITFSRLRGQVRALAGPVLLVNDSYNANPVSMRAALDHLASLGARRRVAVLGEMRELGPDAPAYHREVGAHARGLGIGPIIGVGELGAEYAPDVAATDAHEAADIVESLLEPGDVVLLKGSRAVGLERVAERLEAVRPAEDPS